MREFLRRCENLLTYLAVVPIFLMMCLTTADAVGRYAFNRPIVWAYEITESYLMVPAVFLGICFAYRGGAFIRMTFVAERLPPRVSLVLKYVVQLISVLLLILLLVATLDQAWSTISRGRTLDVLHIPVGPAYLLVPAGFLFAAVALVLDLPRIKKGRSSLFIEESDKL